MTKIVAFFLWLFLLTPAMNVGKAWQSHAEPGRVVTVNFKTGPIDGQMFYKINGDAWLKDEQGAEHRLDGTETISGHVSTSERSAKEILSSSWRGITPIVLITFFLLGIQFRPRKKD